MYYDDTCCQSAELIVEGLKQESFDSIHYQYLENIVARTCKRVARKANFPGNLTQFNQEVAQNVSIRLIKEPPSSAKDIYSYANSAAWDWCREAIEDRGRFLRDTDEEPYERKVGFEEQIYHRIEPSLQCHNLEGYCSISEEEDSEQATRRSQDQTESQLFCLLSFVKGITEKISNIDYYRQFFKNHYVLGFGLNEVAEGTVSKSTGKRICRTTAQNIRRIIIEESARLSITSSENIELAFRLCRPALRMLFRYRNGEEAQHEDMLRLFDSIPSEGDLGAFDCSQLDLIAQRQKVLHSSDPLPTRTFPQALAMREQALPRMLEKLRSREGPLALLRPYQVDKLEKVIELLIKQSRDPDLPGMVCDITPPAGGKSCMMAALAYLASLEGINSVFVTCYNSIIAGSDGAGLTFRSFFGEDVGVVNASSQEYGRTCTLINYAYLCSPEAMSRVCAANAPFLFLLDEADLATTEERLKQLQSIEEASSFPLVVGFSGTTKSNGRNLRDFCIVSDEMPLSALIKLGHAKHMVGYYIQANVEAAPAGTEFKILRKEERALLISIPVEIYYKRHKGQKAIIHCQWVAEAKHALSLLKERGVRAALISGENSEVTNEHIQNEYIDPNGEVDVLVGVDMIKRGFSDKGVTRALFYARFTESETDLYQGVCRGNRPSDDNILTVYQLLPRDINIGAKRLVLLEDVFSVGFYGADLSAETWEDRALDQELLRRDQYDCLIVEPQNVPSERTEQWRIISRELIEAVDTRNKVLPSHQQNKPFSWAETKTIFSLFVTTHKINGKMPNPNVPVRYNNREIDWDSFITCVTLYLTDSPYHSNIRKMRADTFSVLSTCAQKDEWFLNKAQELFAIFRKQRRKRQNQISRKKEVLRESGAEIINLLLAENGNVKLGSTTKIARDASIEYEGQTYKWGWVKFNVLALVVPSLNFRQLRTCASLAEKCTLEFASSGELPPEKDYKSHCIRHLDKERAKKLIPKAIQLNGADIFRKALQPTGISPEDVSATNPKNSMPVTFWFEGTRIDTTWRTLKRNLVTCVLPEITLSEAKQLSSTGARMITEYVTTGEFPDSEEYKKIVVAAGAENEKKRKRRETLREKGHIIINSLLSKYGADKEKFAQLPSNACIEYKNETYEWKWIKLNVLLLTVPNLGMRSARSCGKVATACALEFARSGKLPTEEAYRKKCNEHLQA